MFFHIEKKGMEAPGFEPEVVSVDRSSEAVDRIYDMKSELGAYSMASTLRG